MPDLFVLSILSRPMKILNRMYHVAWDAARSVAIILYVEETDDDFDEYRATLEELKNPDGSSLTFPFEIEAHKYLIALKQEQDPGGGNEWQSMV